MFWVNNCVQSHGNHKGGRSQNHGKVQQQWLQPAEANEKSWLGWVLRPKQTTTALDRCFLCKFYLKIPKPEFLRVFWRGISLLNHHLGWPTGPLPSGIMGVSQNQGRGSHLPLEPTPGEHFLGNHNESSNNPPGNDHISHLGKGKSSTQRCRLADDMWSFPGG